MSTILNNVFDLLFESEIELDDKFIQLYEAGMIQALTSPFIQGGKEVFRAGKKVYDSAVDKTSTHIMPHVAPKYDAAVDAASDQMSSTIPGVKTAVKQAQYLAGEKKKDFSEWADETGKKVGNWLYDKKQALKDAMDNNTKAGEAFAKGNASLKSAIDDQSKEVAARRAAELSANIAKVKQGVGDAIGQKVSAVTGHIKAGVKAAGDRKLAASDRFLAQKGVPPTGLKGVPSKASADRFTAQKGITPSGTKDPGIAEPESMLAKGLKWGADNSTAIAAVSGAVLGAGLLAKYHNSIMRGNYLVNHYGKLAASAKNPSDKAKYTERLNWAKNKLASAQAKARTEHKSFIEKSQTMKSQIAQLNKAGRKDEAAKLNEKLARRQKFLTKIGAKI